MSIILKLLGLVFVSLLVNVPMGFWRRSAQKYSINWFLAIHLTVPLIIWMRIGTGITYAVVPLLILAALLGQLLGSLCYRWADRAVLVEQQRGKG